MKWRSKFVALILLLFAGVACASPQEKARMQLGQMNVKYDESSFVERARAADILSLKLFLHAGINPNVINKNGETALVVAARFGREEVVEALLADSANPNIRDKQFGATPLIWASVNGYPNLVKLLLGKGADVEAKEIKNGMTALMSAAVGGKTEVIKLLLEKGAEVNTTDNNNRTAVMWAAHYGHAEAVKLLLDEGANLGVKEKSQGLDVLMVAAANGKAEAVKILLDRGADANAIDDQAKTVLMWAAQNGCNDVLSLLLEKGAKVNARDKDNRTALDLAREYRQKDAEEILLKAGASEKKGEAEEGKGEQKSAAGRTPAEPAASNPMKITVVGKIAKAEQSYIIQGQKPPELFTILNANPNVLDKLVKSGKTVTIEAVSVVGDNVNIRKIDGKAYQEPKAGKP